MSRCAAVVKNGTYIPTAWEPAPTGSWSDWRDGIKVKFTDGYWDYRCSKNAKGGSPFCAHHWYYDEAIETIVWKNQLPKGIYSDSDGNDLAAKS